jgi:GNAT superfamily N-acetyltransferase
VSVFKSALNELYRGYNLPLVTAPDPGFVPLHRHFLSNDSPRFWVAEVDARLVGFGAGILRGDWWYLAALFVAPGVQGRGIGRALLEHARIGATPSRVAATITDALQPVSNTLYAHHGLIPWLPVLVLGGRPEAVAAPPLPRGCEIVPLDAGLLEEVRLIDESVTGLDRSVDHAFLLSAEGLRQAWLLRRGGKPGGYVYIREEGLIGPVASTRPDDMALLVRFAMAALAERGAEHVYAAVPGPNAAAQRTLLDAGLFYEGCPGLLLASARFGHFDRYVIAAYGLM